MAFSTSNFLTILTPLLGIGLMFTSAYSWWNVSRLYLPLSRFIAFLSTFLPILSLASIQYLRSAHRQPTKSRRRKGAQSPPPITDKMFFSIFALLLVDTALLTLDSTSLPSKALSCPLNDQWTHLWSPQSERHSTKPAIKTIQDTLYCCGLHSKSDKFYPFPPYNTPDGKTPDGKTPEKKPPPPNCDTFYPDRAGHSCYQPWLQQTQLSAGMFLAAIAGSMVMKIAALVLIRYNNHTWVQRILYNSWFGKQDRIEEEEVSTGEGRIRDVDDEDDEAFVYDGDARVRGNGNVRGRYLDAPEGENDRLLGNGDEENGATGELRRTDIYNDGGFGTLQPSLLR